MSTITTTTLACDLDGTLHTDDDPVATVQWGLDGQPYEIDVCTRHELDLREVLERHALAGRRVGRAAAVRPTTPRVPAVDRPKRPTASRPDRERNQRIREWAREQGMDVPERGRLAGDVIAAYEEAHP